MLLKKKTFGWIKFQNSGLNLFQDRVFLLFINFFNLLLGGAIPDFGSYWFLDKVLWVCVNKVSQKGTGSWNWLFWPEGCSEFPQSEVARVLALCLQAAVSAAPLLTEYLFVYFLPSYLTASVPPELRPCLNFSILYLILMLFPSSDRYFYSIPLCTSVWFIHSS